MTVVQAVEGCGAEPPIAEKLFAILSPVYITRNVKISYSEHVFVSLMYAGNFLIYAKIFYAQKFA